MLKDANGHYGSFNVKLPNAKHQSANNLCHRTTFPVCLPVLRWKVPMQISIRPNSRVGKPSRERLVGRSKKSSVGKHRGFKSPMTDSRELIFRRIMDDLQQERERI